MVFSPPWGARAGCSGKLSVTPRIAAQTLRVWDELLVALMLVEILDTVRISICSHLLVTEPFLVIGLIASIRRMLVISLELATLSKQAHGRPRARAFFALRHD